MSKMADLAYDIEQLYIEGYSAITISAILKCPVELVIDYLKEHKLEDNEASREFA
jgi:hypothetical protein